MRLLRRCDTGDFSLTQVDDEAIPPYAILSHTWGADTEEVTFEDLKNGTGKDKPGYDKIQFCGEQAAQDDLEWFWIDTCCIDKANKGELSQAIKSMFRWYQNAVKCYAYLSDVSTAKRKASDEISKFTWEPAFRVSRWFTRGWTLQELLAPTSVEFFSQEWKRLGDKRSLRQQIYKITGIPDLALQGTPLSQFSVNERLSWIENRQTKLEEDKAYSLLGIFDVFIPPIYSEGTARAFKRLMDEIDKQQKCIQDLHLTDPRDDKKRIEDTKGGLLKNSYRWVFENSDFQRWRDDQQSRLLWIKGDPGKGKTMLLCGIVNELKKSTAKKSLLSFFFCQATDSRINSATAVLRGLLYLLIDQQPSLISNIRKKHDHAGKALFEDANAWIALSEIFIDILQDSSLNPTYLIIDALDECVIGLPKLLGFIVRTSAVSSRVKWIVSSRNQPDIEQELKMVEHKVRLSLELNTESISAAVHVFIKQKVSQLAQKKEYNNRTRDAVLEHLACNANNTFLWVALVCQNLEQIPRWNVLKKLNTFPPGLDSLYERMTQQIRESEDADLYTQILALVTVVYRPITMKELASLAELPELLADDLESIREIIGLCGSFLTLRKNTVYFVHQSAKDFLLTKASNTVFPTGRKDVHYVIFSRSLQAMSSTLRRDMYNLNAFGYPAKKVEQPDLDPLAASRYSCIYWIDHLYDSDPNSLASYSASLRYEGTIYEFIRKKYLYWLEALCLCESMSKGVVSMAKLEALIQGRTNASILIDLIRDARRFIMYHRGAIENSPLQAYMSALMFSPTRSLIRDLFKREEPGWITIRPDMRDGWSACLQTLEGHSGYISSVAFSHDSAWLASDHDKMAKIWDASSGECLQKLEGHSSFVNSVAFSHDSARLASASYDRTVKIWDTSSGECLQTLEGHSRGVKSVAFSHDSARLASASDDKTVKIWDASSGECLQTLEGHSSFVNSVAFSHDSARLASASGSDDNAIKIWDASSGECLQTLEGHGSLVNSVAFSHDSARLASASYDKIVKIWDASSGECLQTLEGHCSFITSVAFSHDSARLASGSDDNTIKIWDASSGECLQTLEGHSRGVKSVAFSHDSARLASASDDNTIKIWDASSDESFQMLEGHSSAVKSVAFSHDSARLASVSIHDNTVKIWDASSGECLQTLKGHSGFITSVAFSHDSTRLASASALYDNTVKIWDASSGECLQTLESRCGLITSVTFSHDSARLALASVHSNTVEIWDASSGECFQALNGHCSGVHSVAFSHDSARLASASHDKVVKIWDASSGKCLQTLEGHSDYITSAAFSHDSARLASASHDNTIKIWDASSGECLQTLEGHSDDVTSVAFSHDSAWLASTSDDKTVKIWDTSSGECLQTLIIGKALVRISFDITDSYLQTEIGAIEVSALSDSRACLSHSEPRSPQYQGLALGADGVWITYNSENLIWLPSEYRPLCSVVSEKMIGIGVGTGRVWIFKVELNAKARTFAS
ncbi:WD40 repeat-like protein [Lojkania enalia]|uniref:WD40 repeat-like protein n=1 Tax=Lojkania enalia TaxID=147567 RepID=A0A9P4K085_9PLEO|nr:WD40 repeat-like protein [Didymosphaeria enalia]